MTLERICEKPGCDKSGGKTYTGKHDNELLLCDRHYYKLVTGDSSIDTVSPTIPTNTTGNFDLDISSGNRNEIEWYKDVRE